MTQFPQGQPMNPGQQPQYAQPPQRTGMSGCAKFAIGCGTLLIIGIIATVAIVWYIASNAKSLISGAVASQIKTAVDAAQISPEQKKAINARIDQLKQDFVAGKIDAQQLAQVAQSLAEGPMLPVGMVLFVDQFYLQTSSLPAEEKAEGRKTLERFARGIYEKSIDRNALNTVTAPISEPDPAHPGQTRVKPQPTVQELRDFLVLAKEEADAANIPDERWEFDLAAELDNAIEQAKTGSVSDPGAAPGN